MSQTLKPLFFLFICFVHTTYVVVSQNECTSMDNFVEKRLCMMARKAAIVTKQREEEKRFEGMLHLIMPDDGWTFEEHCRCCRTDLGGERPPICKTDCARLELPAEWKHSAPKQCSEPFEVCTRFMRNRTTDNPDLNWDCQPHYCMDLACVHEFFDHQSDGRKLLGPLGKALRKEYRMLSDYERSRFHEALWEMKRAGVYDTHFAGVHARYAESEGAHHGPAFLPWHREFIKSFEIQLRMIDPDLALPYWDTALDARLLNPSDSVLWSDELMGLADASGRLTSGTFKEWESINWNDLLENTFNSLRPIGVSDVQVLRSLINQRNYGISRIRRNMGRNGSRPMDDDQIFSILQQPNVNLLLATHGQINKRCPLANKTLEWFHGYVHVFVGGDMDDSVTAANDPVFFLLHSFVDMIWELWRETYQTAFEQENVYPEHLDKECTSAKHHHDRMMHPYSRRANIDGLSTKYTDNLYMYQLRPSCSYQMPSCASKYLFCDFSHGWPKCVSKLRKGASCRGYLNNEDMCYESVCINARCQVPPPMEEAGGTRWNSECAEWCQQQCSSAGNDQQGPTNCNLRCYQEQQCFT